MEIGLLYFMIWVCSLQGDGVTPGVQCLEDSSSGFCGSKRSRPLTGWCGH